MISRMLTVSESENWDTPIEIGRQFNLVFTILITDLIEQN